MPAAQETIKKFQQKVENLEAVIKIRTDYERFVYNFSWKFFFTSCIDEKVKCAVIGRGQYLNNVDVL